MFSEGVGHCNVIMREMVAERLGLLALKDMCKNSVNCCRAISPDNRTKLLNGIDLTNVPASMPMLDAHAHLAGSIAGDKIYSEIGASGKRKGTLQDFVEPPTKRTFIVDEKRGLVCTNPWTSLKSFSEDTYQHLFGLTFAKGVDKIAYMMVMLAKDAIQCNVYGFSQMQVPLPSSYSESWLYYYGGQLLVAKERANLIQVRGVSFTIVYALDAIRSIPSDTARKAAAEAIRVAAHKLNTGFNSLLAKKIAQNWDTLHYRLATYPVVKSPHPAKLPGVQTLFDVAVLILSTPGLQTDMLFDKDKLLPKVMSFVNGFEEEKNFVTPVAKFKYGQDAVLQNDERLKLYIRELESAVLNNIDNVYQII
jgi:hypothetical protein